MLSDLGGTVLAMVAIVALWSIAILIMIGIGILVGRLLRLEGRARLATFFWLGLAATVAWVFLIHLFLPLDSVWARLPLVLAAVVGWWLLFRSEPDRFRSPRPPRQLSEWLVPLGLVGLSLVLANLALGQPSNYDAYLYHFASIRHYAEYGAIEGLANLHYRLGFQAATIPLAALIDLPPFNGEGFRLVAGFLGVALVFELVSRYRRALREKRLLLGDVLLGFAVLVLFFIPGAASPTDMFASPSLDTGAAILCLVAFAYFADALASRSGDTVAVAFVLLCLAATFRQLNLLVLLLGALVLLFIVRDSSFDGRVHIGITLLAGGLILILSMVHSTVVSGYPLYPATFPSLGLSWANPPSEAAEVREVITQYARGRLRDPIDLMASPGATTAWFGEWVQGLRDSGQLNRLMLLGFVSLLSVLALGASRGRANGLRRLGLLYFPIVPTLIFWFVTAPLLRFGLGPMALFFAIPPVLLLMGGRYEVELRGIGRLASGTVLTTGFVCLLVLLAGLLMAAAKWSPQGSPLVLADGDGRLGSREPVPVRVQRALLGGGVSVFRPTVRDWCGPELWCTPYFEYGIKMRGESLSDGFERLPEESPPATPESE